MDMKRRDFVRTSVAATMLVGHRLARAASAGSSSLLLETTQFAQPGGWMLDTQFHNVLGFSYLLAHGMGSPVENARTTATLPQKGTYHVWIHTKNWCPGDWKAPGRFSVLVDGRPLDRVFGTEPGWDWQSGGTVDVADTKVEVEFQDLTGFEGRCSAIYFTRAAGDKPPKDGKALAAWRRKQAGLPEGPSQTLDFDVVIVGGGITGCSAALAAEAKGLNVALIQNRPVLGGNASGEIRVHTIGISAKAEAIVSQIDTEHYPNGSAKALQADKKRAASMAAAKGIRQFLLHTLVEAERKGARIESVTACDHRTGQLIRFKSPVFIDCSGDGWLGEMAGAAFVYGRESRNQYDEGWEKHGDLWSPAMADNRVMGTSLLWNTAPLDKPASFPEVPWAAPVAKHHVATGGEWYWEYSDNDLNQIDDAEAIRDHLFRAIYGTYANTIKQAKHENLGLDWVAYNGGKRESRRLVGDYLYKGTDARDSVEFPDAVVTEQRDIDLHYQQKLTGSPFDFLSKALFLKPKNTYYYIPFRSLYSKNIENLMVAGRCFSCTHVGLGGPRVMKTCGQMGVATGNAAYLCKKHGATPRDVGREHIQELRQLCGYSGRAARPGQ